VRKLADFIVTKASDISTLNGRSPNSLAAAAIFLAASYLDNARTAEDIGRTCGAAENTIRQTAKLMQNAPISKLLPPDFKPINSTINLKIESN
jgi:transcription initiation factor TFIIB